TFMTIYICMIFFFFQAEDGIRDFHVTGVQTCALPISYTSLHKPIYDLEGDRTLMEVLISDQAQDPETLVINRERLIYAQRHIKETLSDFEYRVFRLYINGLSYKEMAERLNTHTKSIDNALCRIKNKIDTHF